MKSLASCRKHGERPKALASGRVAEWFKAAVLKTNGGSGRERRNGE
jgi:hypothetical protein